MQWGGGVVFYGGRGWDCEGVIKRKVQAPSGGENAEGPGQEPGPLRSHDRVSNKGEKKESLRGTGRSS